MKIQHLCATAVASLIFFGGCEQKSDTAQKSSALPPSPTSSANPAGPKPTAENSVAVVNGFPISKAYVQSILADIAQRSG